MENTVQIQPMTRENWSAFEELFGPKGACGGSWCMHWRLQHAEYEKISAQGRHQAMKKLVYQTGPEFWKPIRMIQKKRTHPPFLSGRAWYLLVNKPVFLKSHGILKNGLSCVTH